MAKKMAALRTTAAKVHPASSADIVKRLARRTAAAGTLSGPCIPALARHYFEKLQRLFEIFDRPLSDGELASMRDAFYAQIAEGFAASPYARFVFAYRPSESNPAAFDCTLSILLPTLAEQYQDFLRAQGENAPFGKHPDAMVMHVVAAQRAAQAIHVLDFGAGNGRNTLPLARLGNPVDSVEPVHELAEALRRDAETEQLSVRLLDLDLLEGALDPLLLGRYAVIILSEVTPHLAQRDFAHGVNRLAKLLAPGGTLLFNAFITKDGYEPDELARETAQSVWSTFFTRRELKAMMAPLGLTLTRDEPCVAYEREHAAAGSWPPTPWYVNWAEGKNLFGDARAPLELRWLAYARIPA
jgi:2-polyprenyl-3-methyl-5-hydroxy-6-metoxy-1,4-benzoquinol methylase